MTAKKTSLILAAVLTFKALLMLFVNTSLGLELAPDEAQYWTWSRFLDWGYYSKPPGIAWEIWLGTSLFGDTLLGIRFGAIVISTLIPIVLYQLARECKLSPEASLLSAIIAAFTPMGFLASFYATTDGGLILFWSIGCLLIARALVRDEPPSYIFLGLVIGAGALFKWPIYLLWVVVAVLVYRIPVFRCSTAIVGLLLSSFGLVPSLIWNARRGWPTFLHVLGQIAGGKGGGAKGNFFDFFAAQAALLSPLFFLLLLIGFYFLIRHKDEVPKGVRFLGYLTLALIGAYQFTSLFKKIQGNWVAFAYPTGIVFLSWFIWDKALWGRKWVAPSFALSAVLILFIFGIPVMQAHQDIPIPLKYSHLKECLGWGCVEEKLISAGYDPARDFLVSDSYQMTAILHYYGPEKQRVYFLNVWDHRKNQYSYWPQLADEKMGKSGFFATARNITAKEIDKTAETLREAVAPYFADVKFVESYPIVFAGGGPAKVLFVYRVESYNGKVPPESDLY